MTAAVHANFTRVKVVPKSLGLKFAADALLATNHKALFCVLAQSFASTSMMVGDHDELERNTIAEIKKANEGQKLGSKVCLKFFEKDEDDEMMMKKKTYIIMIQAFGDKGMVALGKKYGFPRGCCVVWRPDAQSVCVRGFYKKFKNDDDTSSMHEWETIVGGVTHATISKKFSGFLGHLIAFKDEEGNVWWTTCSKNSADKESFYVKEIRKIAEPLMTTKLVERLATDKLYLGGEFLSTEDTHGYIAKENAVVFTCIGQKKPESYNMFDHWSVDGLIDFCNEFNLPCDGSVSITGPNVVQILNDIFLMEQRDTMMYSDFATRLSLALATYGPDAVLIRRCSNQTDHQKLVGNIMEGLVLHLNDGHILKWKVLHYIWRTMILRPFLEPFAPFTNDQGIIMPARMMMGRAELLTDANHKRMEKFLVDWGCTAEGRVLFAQNIKAAMMLAVDLDVITARTHVELADKLLLISSDELQALALAYDAARQTKPTARHVLRCVLVTGPIGAGKSTVAKKIADLFVQKKQAVCLIDGDFIVPGPNGWAQTKTLGIQRNGCTLALFTEAWRKDEIVVCSMGGGVVTRSKPATPDNCFDDEAIPECFLRELVRKEFGDDFGLALTSVTMIAATSSESAVVAPLDLETVTQSYYRVRSEFTEQVIKDRVHVHKVWPYSQKCLDLHEHSMLNKRHSVAIMNAADIRVGFPFSLDTQQTRDSINTQFRTSGQAVFGHIIKPLSRPTKIVDGGLVHQIRTIIKVNDKSLHLTHLYASEGVRMSQPEIEAFRGTLGGSIDLAEAQRVTLFLEPTTTKPAAKGGKKAADAVAKVVVVVLKNGSHLTDAAGPFQPKDMSLVAKWWLNGADQPLQLVSKTGAVYVLKELMNGTPKSGGNDGTPFKAAVPPNFVVEKDNLEMVVLIESVAMGFASYNQSFFVPRAVKKIIEQANMSSQ